MADRLSSATRIRGDRLPEPTFAEKHETGRLPDPEGSGRRPVRATSPANGRQNWNYYFFFVTFFVVFFGHTVTGFLPFRLTTRHAFGVALATVIPTDTDRITLSAVKPDT